MNVGLKIYPQSGYRRLLSNQEIEVVTGAGLAEDLRITGRSYAEEPDLSALEADIGVATGYWDTR